MLLCESIITLGLRDKTKVFHASTSEMYGDHSAETSFNEQSEFRPMSPYAVSKVAAFHACSFYARVYGV